MSTGEWWITRLASCFVALCVPLAAQWHAIGPFGGAVAVVQVDSQHPDTVLAATRNALLFRSRDGGENWEPLSFPPQLHAVLHAFIIGPDGSYLAGLGSDSPAYSGLFRSADEGRTWNRVAGLAGREIWSLALWPGDPKIMAAGCRDGVYRTVDDGATWNRISPLANRELQPVVSLAFDPGDSKILFAGTPHLPWKTADGGASWHSIHSGMLDDSDVFSIQVDASASRNVYATACSGIYFSGTGGDLWTKLAGSSNASYRTYVVAQDPKQSGTVFAGTAGGLIRSTDRGRSWKKLSDDAARYVAFDPTRPGRIFVATDQHGVLRSDDGGDSLRSANRGLCNRYFSSLTAAGADLFSASIYEAASGGVFRLASGGVEWERTAPASTLLGEQILGLTAPAAGTGTLYAVAYRSLLESPDNGKTWKRIPGPPVTGRLLSVVEYSQGLVLASESGLFRSGDRGRTWAKAQVPTGSGAIRSIASVDEETLAAVTSAGVILSHDGIAWTAAAPLPGKTVYAVVSPATGTILAATSAGLMRSVNAGGTWEPVRWTAGSSTVSAICVDPAARRHLYAAVYGSVYESGDAGQTWAPSSAEPSSMISVRALAVVPGQTGHLYALTQHQGIFVLQPTGSPAGVSASVSNQIANAILKSRENHEQLERRQENK